ncbi:MAG: PHP domain-containing protein [Candidatus Nanohaloarchaea archaeon]
MPADLHMHTHASDGNHSVEERKEQANEEGLDHIAITDHDTIPEILDSRYYWDDERGVGVITGSEIKCEVDGTGIEILAYFIDPDSAPVNEVLEKNAENRKARIEEMVHNLDSVIDYDLTVDEVMEEAGSSPGRPDIARVLADAREVGVETLDEAFERHLHEDSEAYVPTPKLGAEEVIDAVLEDGGVPVLAHPGRDLSREGAAAKVEELVEYGLKGLEVYYTWDHKRKAGYGVAFGETYARELADEFGLFKTGGSDCHGEGTGKYLIGDVKLPDYRVEILAEEAGVSLC